MGRPENQLFGDKTINNFILKSLFGLEYSLTIWAKVLFVDTLEALRRVKGGCFGAVPDPDYIQIMKILMLLGSKFILNMMSC